MKKNSTKFLIGLVSAVTLAFSGCEKDYFDTQPDNNLSMEAVFSNRDLTERWWAGLFSGVPVTWAQPYTVQWGIMTDELNAHQWVNPPLNSGALSAANTPSNHNYLWEQIRLASIFLERVDENQEIMELQGGEEIIKHYKGDARFLRAYYHWLIMKMNGPIPIPPSEPASPEDPLQIPRSTWDESVAFVLSELEQAKQDVPVNQYMDGSTNVDGTKLGRINKLIIEALESKILLYHASPLYNGNTEMSDFRNNDGTVLINQTYDASRWDRAAEAAKDAIDIAEANGKGLYRVNDADPFRAAFLSVRDLYWDGWETEGIFMRPWSNIETWQFHAAPRSVQGTPWSGTAVIQRLVDDYRMADGSTIEESPIYDENSYTNQASPYYAQGTNTMYTNREARFYAHISFNGAITPATPKPGFENSRVELFNTGTSGKGSDPRNYSTTGYLARKNIHPNFSKNPLVLTQRPAMMIRVAELYLSYAEALNEAEPGHPDVLEYLNRVRTRGGLPALNSGLSQDQMREEIRMERRLELTFENHRYFDVRRWKIPDEEGSRQGGVFYGMNIEAGTHLSDPEFHQRTPLFTRNPWQRRFYFMPFAQNEMDRNKALVQPPGY